MLGLQDPQIGHEGSFKKVTAQNTRELSRQTTREKKKQGMKVFEKFINWSEKLKSLASSRLQHFPSLPMLPAATRRTLSAPRKQTSQTRSRVTLCPCRELKMSHCCIVTVNTNCNIVSSARDVTPLPRSAKVTPRVNFSQPKRVRACLFSDRLMNPSPSPSHVWKSRRTRSSSAVLDESLLPLLTLASAAIMNAACARTRLRSMLQQQHGAFTGWVGFVWHSKVVMCV